MRLAAAAACLFVSLSVVAQTGSTTQVSDPTALSLAQKSLAALSGGNSIADVTLNATVISIWGGQSQTGSGTFAAQGWGQSRIDLNLGGGTRTDVRNLSNSVPAGAWSTNQAPASKYVSHNCWTEAAWFFPGLTSLAQFANSSFVFRYIGLEQHSGLTVQHIQVFQAAPQDKTGTTQRLTTTDFYLDANSLLPMALAFKEHSDTDVNTDLPIEIRFANYQQPTKGILVPYHIQELLNGTVVQDVTVTSSAVNTGLPAATFSLP
jgi:hypothetical protein